MPTVTRAEETDSPLRESGSMRKASKPKRLETRCVTSEAAWPSSRPSAADVLPLPPASGSSCASSSPSRVGLPESSSESTSSSGSGGSEEKLACNRSRLPTSESCTS